tara:strand:- start:161 stop:286 length:126 start_codon:yes stop_codon:yes gene_type:complete
MRRRSVLFLEVFVLLHIAWSKSFALLCWDELGRVFRKICIF